MQCRNVKRSGGTFQQTASGGERSLLAWAFASIRLAKGRWMGQNKRPATERVGANRVAKTRRLGSADWVDQKGGRVR